MKEMAFDTPSFTGSTPLHLACNAPNHLRVLCLSKQATLPYLGIECDTCLLCYSCQLRRVATLCEGSGPVGTCLFLVLGSHGCCESVLEVAPQL